MSKEIIHNQASWVPSSVKVNSSFDEIIENMKKHVKEQFGKPEELYFSQYDKICFDAYREECKKNAKR